VLLSGLTRLALAERSIASRFGRRHAQAEGRQQRKQAGARLPHPTPHDISEIDADGFVRPRAALITPTSTAS
jgi:hypothetical protein